MTPAEAIQQIQDFILSVETHLDNQPPANNLDLCDTFLRELHVLYFRWAQLNGLAESMLANLVHRIVTQTDDDTYKRIKHSSTLVSEFAKGQHKTNDVAILLSVKGVGQLLKTTSDNYRTLISSYRQERDMANKGVRQTVQ